MDPDMVNCIKLRLKSKTLHLNKCEHSVRVRKVKAIILWICRTTTLGHFSLKDQRRLCRLKRNY